MRKNRLKRGALVFALLFGLLFALLGAWAARSPDRELVLVREIDSELAQPALIRELQRVRHWPEWHHMAIQVEAVDAEGRGLPNESQVLERNGLLRMVFEPKRRRSRRFEILAKVLDYDPARGVRLALLKDTSGKLEKLLGQLEWAIEVFPRAESRSTIRAEVRAKTHSWRARLFALLAPKVLLNQVFYPDLMKLAGSSELPGISITPGN